MTDWSYEGATGPDKWADLDPAWAVARLGVRQSPIDLGGAAPGGGTDLGVEYDAVVLTDVTNDGHTVHVGVSPGGVLRFDGRQWTLGGLHFHTPSEHRINGEAFDMEIHLVHADDQSRLAVLGIFSTVGGSSAALDVVFDEVPDGTESIDLRAAGIPVVDLLPADLGRWLSYTGSLTTPPFTEQVQWIVLEQPIEVSESEIAAMRDRFGANARPVQPTHGRRVHSPG